MEKVEMAMQMFREYLKDIPYDLIIKLTEKEFPQLASKAQNGDKIAMFELSKGFFTKATECLNSGSMETSISYGATALFWSDKAKV